MLGALLIDHASRRGAKRAEAAE